MKRPIKRITVVGGGTSGWLAAMMFNNFLNDRGRQPKYEITLIESPRIPTIGVGEATIISLASLMQSMNIDEAELIRRTNASFKLSVRFSDWVIDKSGVPITFYHPFNNPRPVGDWDPIFHYQKFGPRWPGTSLADSVVPNLAIIRAGKGPRPIDLGNYNSPIHYAYHIDAGLFAGFMRDVAVSRGVEHIRDDVVDIELSESGMVSVLQLQEGGRYPVEFVVDCTGFNGLLVSRLSNQPMVSLAKRLMNDRAIPIQIPHRNPSKIEPCTRATALGAGWVWRVPLYSRVGTGYVYSSAFRSDDEARDEFIGYLRAIGDLAPDQPDPDLTRVIKMKIGYRRDPWVKNCVAIGLSGGFVEPLEATAIFAIERTVKFLIQHFPNSDFDPALIKSYNAKARALYENIIDFIQVHYVTSNRPEPYWQAAHNDLVPSDQLGELLNVWQSRMPTKQDIVESYLFGFWNYLYVLQPKGYFSSVPIPFDASVRFDDWQSFSQNLETTKTHLVARLPDHHSLLTAIRADQSALFGLMTAPTLGAVPPALESRPV